MANATRNHPGSLFEPASHANRFAIWSAHDGSMRIEYARAALEQFRMEALFASRSREHGARGTEIGALIYGTRLGSLVRVLVLVPLECEYAFGPGLRLTSTDQARAEAAIRAAAQMPETRELQLVGCIVSTTGLGGVNRELLQDLRRLVPNAGQPILRFQSPSFTKAEITVLTGADGELTACAPVLTLDPCPSAALATAPPAPRVKLDEPIFEQRVAARADAGSAQLPWSVRLGLLAGIAAAMLLCYALVAAPILEAVSASPPKAELLPLELLSLDVKARPRQWVLTWNAASTSVARSSQGRLEMQSGDSKKEVLLSTLDVRRGLLTVPREAAAVRITLLLVSGDEILASESTAYHVKRK